MSLSTRAAVAATALVALTAAPASAVTLHRAQAQRLARAIVARHAAATATGPVDCVGPAGDPAPGTPQWTLRDEENQYCATERLQDEYANPAFGSTFWSETPQIFVDQNVEMLMNPTHPHLTLAQFVPGGTTTDPYRTIARWTAAKRGRVDKLSFTATDGATLNGYLFRPPASVPGPYPGIVITTGSIQGYQQMYFWAAEGLAEAGYEVLAYDVQGQGTSDTFGADCTPPAVPSGQCQGVPFQQSYNFYQGTEDALNYFFSAKNPGRADLDPQRVGIAGHSLGAQAVSHVGQCDPRVRAIVAWDYLAEPEATCTTADVHGYPAGSPATPTQTTPALGISSEYFFNPEPMSSPPDPQGTKAAEYLDLAKRGTDAMQVTLRSSTHLEYTYVPYILPASRLGERVAFYYTLAWFDRYVKGDPSAFHRLTARRFDASADASSIGAGGYDPAAAAADPADTTAGNVPYALAGLPVADRLSFYYDSEYHLSPPGGGAAITCRDMRAHCP
jgi:dienelactone hydrolase